MKVYYFFCDNPKNRLKPEEWIINTLFISLEGTPRIGSRVLILSAFEEGITNISGARTRGWKEWPHELSNKALKRFIKACFS